MMLNKPELNSDQEDVVLGVFNIRVYTSHRWCGGESIQLRVRISVLPGSLACFLDQELKQSTHCDTHSLTHPLTHSLTLLHTLTHPLAQLLINNRRVS